MSAFFASALSTFEYLFPSHDEGSEKRKKQRPNFSKELIIFFQSVPLSILGKRISQEELFNLDVKESFNACLIEKEESNGSTLIKKSMGETTWLIEAIKQRNVKVISELISVHNIRYTDKEVTLAARISEENPNDMLAFQIDNFLRAQIEGFYEKCN